MSEQLFMEERRRSILAQLEKFGRVSVKDLSEKLNVSEVTIRQDLRALADANQLERTHGGAVLPRQDDTTPELSFDMRLREYNNIKTRIAHFAARFVHHGDSIALDASTTAYAMLPFLKQLERLIVVTNSLVIAQELLDYPNIQVMMPGGKLRRDSVSLVGTPEALPNIHLTAGFISVHGYTPETGFTESSQDEVQIKQAMLDRCIHQYIMLDERKWGKIAPYTMVDLKENVTIITTRNAPHHMITGLHKQKIDIRFID